MAKTTTIKQIFEMNMTFDATGIIQVGIYRLGNGLGNKFLIGMLVSELEKRVKTGTVCPDERRKVYYKRK